MFDHYKDVRECLIEENSELKSNKTYIEAYTILIDTTFIESQIQNYSCRSCLLNFYFHSTSRLLLLNGWKNTSLLLVEIQMTSPSLENLQDQLLPHTICFRQDPEVFQRCCDFVCFLFSISNMNIFIMYFYSGSFENQKLKAISSKLSMRMMQRFENYRFWWLMLNKNYSIVKLGNNHIGR